MSTPTQPPISINNKHTALEGRIDHLRYIDRSLTYSQIMAPNEDKSTDSQPVESKPEDRAGKPIDDDACHDALDVLDPNAKSTIGDSTKGSK